MSEDEIIQAIENDLYKNTYDIKYSKLLDLYNKQKENNKKLQEGYDKRVREILKLEQRIEELEEIEEEHRKENGKLREKVKELETYYRDMEEVNKKFIAVDKIKEKIEELEKEIEEKQENCCDFTLIHEHEIDTRAIIEVLQELLEE